METQKATKPPKTYRCCKCKKDYKLEYHEPSDYDYMCPKCYREDK